METVLEKSNAMGRTVTGVTIQTFPQAVREAGLQPGQKFTLVVEDVGFDSETALRRIDEISANVRERMALDGITTDEEREAFIQSLDDDR